MKKGAIVLFCLLAVVSLVPVVLMAQNEEAAVETQPVDVPTETLVGTINSIDVTNSTIVLQYLIDEQAQTFQTAQLTVPETAEILKGDESITLADLKENDMVSIEYTTDTEGNKMVQTVRLEN